ncbi:MAG: hypothetical protein PVI99_01870 [Anaerolineales bacterium]|jgi:hypothetical protein
MQRLKWFFMVIALSVIACQLGAGGSQGNAGGPGSGEVGAPDFPTYRLALEEKPANLGRLDLQLNQLGPFHGRFILEFNGQNDWTYQVDTRSDGENIEFSLTIQGVESDKNPGDVRLVNSGGNNYMSGAGTNDFCVRFPDSFETEKLFLGPADFVHPDEFSSAPAEEGSNTVAGINAARYTASADDHRGWQEVVVNYWVDPNSGAVLKYDFVAWGNDPLYKRGDGRIHGVFEVLEVGSQEIEEIPGCQIEFPLPSDAAEIIRLPGIIQFTTSMGPFRLDTFYTDQLEPRGWVREEPQINDQTRSGLLEYNADNESITIHVDAINPQYFEEGFLVEIDLDE